MSVAGRCRWRLPNNPSLYKSRGGSVMKFCLTARAVDNRLHHLRHRRQEDL